MIGPSSMTLAQAAGRRARGTASALQGGSAFLVGACVTPLTGVLGYDSLLPMAILMVSLMFCAFVAGFISLASSRRVAALESLALLRHWAQWAARRRSSRVPVPAEPLKRLGFLTIGLFDEADPRRGHESTLEVIELGEQLGFDSAWVRHRHLQFGISSPVAFLGAASQRTTRIELGTAVIPLGWENPLRLAEDLATVDILSGGRLNPGISVGPPMRWDDVKKVLYPDTAEIEDFSYERVERLLRFVRGEKVTDWSGTEGIEVYSDRVQPHCRRSGERLWYGGGSLRSAQWAGEHAMNFLTSNVVKAEDVSGTSPTSSSPTSAAFRAHHPLGDKARVSQGLVVIPTDSATPAQREKYLEYAAKRTPRTATPQGPARLMFAQDIVGSSAEIAERLYEHAAFREIDEVAFALPFSFEHDDYVQILTDLATVLGPALGWTPAG